MSEPSIGDSLRALAEFFDDHPALEPPLLRLPMISQFADRAVAVAQVAAVLDGLDDLDTEPGVSLSSRTVTLRFGCLDVRVDIDVELLGESREVPTTAVEFVPFTLDELRRRAEVAADDRRHAALEAEHAAEAVAS